MIVYEGQYAIVTVEKVDHARTYKRWSARNTDDNKAFWELFDKYMQLVDELGKGTVDE